MAPLLKSLLGNGSKDRELAEEMRAVLQEMRQERERFQALVDSSSGAAERLAELNDPIVKAGSDVNAVTARLVGMEQRLETLTQLAAQIETLDERSGSMAASQREAEGRLSGVVEDSQKIRTVFEELAQKVDLGLGLKDRLEAFLEIEKPFQLLRGEAEAVREIGRAHV